MNNCQPILKIAGISQDNYIIFYLKQDSCQSVENCWNGVSWKFEKVSFGFENAKVMKPFNLSKLFFQSSM